MRKVKNVISLILVTVMLLSVSAFAASAESEKYVAKISVCCRVVFFGHVWLYFENLTGGDIKVGCYTVPAGQGVSVGTMSLSRSDGAGVYYNIEAYCGNKLGLSGTKSKSTYLTASQLEKASSEIVNRNSWTLNKNCGYFASCVWNSVCADGISYKFLPLQMKSQLSGGIPSMIYPSKDRVYKQQGSGSGANLKKVKNASLLMWVG